LTTKEQAALESMGYYDKWDSGYSKQQSSRPQTISYSLADSPAGLAGWILEKFWSWTDRSAHPEDSYSRDQLLDNVSLYWFTATGASSGRLYWESFGDFAGGECAVPSACSIFPNEIFRASRRWAEKRYTDIRYWNEPEVGGHFAAFEQPDLFVAEMRSAFAWMR
ncbi:MAG: epoxide hydrolase, partial [Acidimicrobiaceae bacterium]|nr:epoxide hydrolase [Acidimicrobiaceae bacterium]